MTDRKQGDPLAAAVRRLASRRARSVAPAGSAPPRDMDSRLTELERELREVRTRINALFFAVLTAALGDLAGRVVLG